MEVVVVGYGGVWLQRRPQCASWGLDFILKVCFGWVQWVSGGNYLGTSENKRKTSEAKAQWSAIGSWEAGPCGLANPPLNVN